MRREGGGGGREGGRGGGVDLIYKRDGAIPHGAMVTSSSAAVG